MMIQYLIGAVLVFQKHSINQDSEKVVMVMMRIIVHSEEEKEL